MSSLCSEIDRRSTLPLIATTLSLLGLGVVSCQPQGQQGQRAAVDTSQILSTFRDSLPQGFEKAVKAGDFEAQASIYAENAYYSHPMHPPVQGRDSIRAVLKRTTPPGATADIRPMDTQILGPNRVAQYGTVTLTFTPEGAEQAQKMTSTFFALFRRTSGGWKITHEALSAHGPPPGAQ